MDMRLSLPSISKTTIKRKLKNLFTLTLSRREAVVSKIIYNALLSNRSIWTDHLVTKLSCHNCDKLRRRDSQKSEWMKLLKSTLRLVSNQKNKDLSVCIQKLLYYCSTIQTVSNHKNWSTHRSTKIMSAQVLSKQNVRFVQRLWWEWRRIMEICVACRIYCSGFN
jgi:hypothetical protein